jgi:putative flippase GtrA
LYIYKYGAWSQLVQFLAVGAMGTVVNLVTLTALLALSAPTRLAVASAIFVSICFNFVLHRRFSFSASTGESWLRQFSRFLAASTAGALLTMEQRFLR